MLFASDDIRSAFLQFFERKDHLRIGAASVIPKNDPTLLFINSGMAPLKPYFTGAQKPPSPRLCNIQPVIRTKDIDDVGDRHHLTLFEMLGSWSIGDYFKDRAVELAYELLVEVMKFPSDRLYATVYGGDPALGLGPDEESHRAWERVGIPDDRIIVLGQDNFWGPAGDTGPCGPCTEVFFDTGAEYGPEWRPGMEFDTTRRYIEIWNAGVFMQLDKQPDGTFVELPFRSVDTGCGVERMAMAMQAVPTVYETDVLAPLQAFVGEQIGTEERLLKTRRRLTDHIRAAAFILAEGVRPSNEGRGYIPRRLLRKCVAISRAEGIQFPFGEAIDVLVETFRTSQPLVLEQAATIKALVGQEQAEFEQVLSRGLRQLEALWNDDAPFQVSGRDAFDLAATYGMPIDVVRELVTDRGGRLDEAGFKDEFRKHQDISRARPAHGATAGGASGDDQAWTGAGVTEFVGYDTLVATGTVKALKVDGQDAGEARATADVLLVTDTTPFYPEGGGQVGDRGTLSAAGATVTIQDARKVGDPGTIVHHGTVTAGVLRVGEPVTLEVADTCRRDTEANHSATHLLHAALREVLGTHVHQAGSLVEAEHLRFDFTHDAKLTADQLHEVESAVNAAVRANVPRQTEELPIQEAKDKGAHAMFGEKYGEVVRVVEFPGYSLELCGGTHVARSGDIGLFRIKSEESIGKGTRRIVALTATAAVTYTLEREAALRGILSKLGVSLSGAESRLSDLLARPAGGGAAPPRDLRAQVAHSVRQLGNGVRLATVRLDEVGRSLRSEVESAARQSDAVVLALSEAGGRATVAVAVPPSLVETHDARTLLAPLTDLVGGRGGGSPGVAQGGGPNLEGLACAAEALEGLLGR